MTPLIEVDGLSLDYRTAAGPVHALRDVSVRAAAGEVLGIVGESGSGKSTLAAAILRLTGANARVTGGSVRYRGQDLLALSPEDMRALRGSRIAMVFQDPMTAFNPVLTVGHQLLDFQHNRKARRADKMARAGSMLERVGIADAATVMNRYPHELSGGMRQRVAIAAALAMDPDVLIADEPTTALDVTMEAQIIHLLRALRTDFGGAIIIVTHHLGVIAELADRVAVMYAGEVVEDGPVDAIFHDARHPYTQALLACDPAQLAVSGADLPTIAGSLPDLTVLPDGCAFAPRCTLALPVCRTAPPRVTLGPGRTALCHRVAA
jgi:oligopeptide/dipeptide ABC transporter ATP-binding protein